MTPTSHRHGKVPPITTLRRRALDAARRQLEEVGPDGLQLRSLASAIGCGVASLYYHFADKDRLLAAIAIEGFQDLRGSIVDAMNSGKFERRIEAASSAYLRFMREHLRLYALMHAENTLANNPEVRAAESEAFEVFKNALMDDKLVPEAHLEEVSLMFWALGRGIASIILTQGELDSAVALKYAQKILSGFQFVREN